MSDYALIFTDPTIIGDERAAGEAFTGESRTALVDLLIPGYAELAPGDKDNTRFLYLVSVANQATGTLAARAVGEGRLSMADLGQEEIDALLNTSRDRPVEWGEWTVDVPLIVLPQTYGNRDKPTGNVTFLDGETETTMLDSLAALGAIEVHVRG